MLSALAVVEPAADATRYLQVLGLTGFRLLSSRIAPRMRNQLIMTDPSPVDMRERLASEGYLANLAAAGGPTASAEWTVTPEGHAWLVA